MKTEKSLKASALAALALLFLACNKQPSADFILNKSEYRPGDVVRATNQSEDAKSYIWTFPDGLNSSSQNAEYGLANYTAAGTYTIKLEAISRKGNKHSQVTKSFTVKEAFGEVVFYKSTACACGIYTISTGNTTKYATAEFASAPICGADGAATFTLSAGTHTFEAQGANSTSNGTITISADACLQLRLY
jgi:PKD repeat protein